MRVWIMTVSLSIAAHVTAIAVIEFGSRSGGRTKKVMAAIELARVPLKKAPAPPPEPVEQLPKPIKKEKRRIAEPAPAPAPKIEEPRKIGIEEAPAAPAAATMAVATGVSLEGEIGTGTSMDPAAPTEAPSTVRGNGRGGLVPIYAVTRLPKPRRMVEPRVPESFRSSSREVVVVVEVEIDRDGRVTGARVIRQAGFGIDEAAVLAARESEFEPALVGEEPVPVRYQIPYRIRVRG